MNELVKDYVRNATAYQLLDLFDYDPNCEVCVHESNAALRKDDFAYHTNYDRDICQHFNFKCYLKTTEKHYM